MYGIALLIQHKLVAGQRDPGGGFGHDHVHIVLSSQQLRFHTFLPFTFFGPQPRGFLVLGDVTSSVG